MSNQPAVIRVASVMAQRFFKPATWPPGAILLVHVLATLPVLFYLLYQYTHVPAAEGIKGQAFSFQSTLPLWVPWAGALGGTTVSLVGVAHHSADWNGPKYALWHLLRPLLGMITGTLAVLILLFVIRGVVGEVNLPATGKPYDNAGLAVLFVLAFVVGFREETFIELVKRVVDVLFGPGSNARAERLAFIPSNLTATVPSGATTTEATVTLHNDTQDTYVVVAADLTVDDARFTATSDATNLDAGKTMTVKVTYTPTSRPASDVGVLTARVGGHTVRAIVRGVAT